MGNVQDVGSVLVPLWTIPYCASLPCGLYSSGAWPLVGGQKQSHEYAEHQMLGSIPPPGQPHCRETRSNRFPFERHSYWWDAFSRLVWHFPRSSRHRGYRHRSLHFLQDRDLAGGQDFRGLLEFQRTTGKASVVQWKWIEHGRFSTNCVQPGTARSLVPWGCLYLSSGTTSFGAFTSILLQHACCHQRIAKGPHLLFGNIYVCSKFLAPPPTHGHGPPLWFSPLWVLSPPILTVDVGCCLGHLSPCMWNIWIDLNRYEALIFQHL